MHRAFDERNIAFYSECNGSYFGDTETIQRLIEAEHKGMLEKLMVNHVLPEVSDRAWSDHLKQQVANANDQLKPRLNRTFLLEVTAYDVPGGARVVMDLLNGGEWAGVLRPEGTFQAEITYYALLKAGFPTMVRLETSEGSEEHGLVFADGKMTTVFGVPKTPIIARYEIEEGGQTCSVRRIKADNSFSDEQQLRDAKPPSTIDLAQSHNMTMLLGHYNLGDDTWSPASPGRIIKEGMLFGALYVDDIMAMRNCKFDMFSGQSLTRGECFLERFQRKAFGKNKVVERLCESSAKMELVGIFASHGGGKKQYFAMDTPTGRAMIDVVKKSIHNIQTGSDPAALLRSPQ
ncbi:hypothetical protein SAMN05444000_10665 [Shimia gijangensis]|uniref:Uncharacterized protein n=1 Tax=Shimia gijangensis TaxID=1470563 RepID=A0A1M6HJ25_9RHOB|nr:hypothetical protein [Shimia gijangensis]SHJ22206.1 hypothetical protein SAMN05444000_10665 [Shimia gijangensis]